MDKGLTTERQDRFRECQVGEAAAYCVVLMYGESFVLNFASTCPRNVRFLLPPRLFVVLPRAAPLWHCGGLVICLCVCRQGRAFASRERTASSAAASHLYAQPRLFAFPSFSDVV